MSAANKSINIPIKTSNLRAAIKQLDGRSFRVAAGQEQAKPVFNVVRVADTIADQESETKDITVDQIAQQFRSPETLLDQAKGLIAHLKQKERELAEEKADHQVRVWNWQQEVGNRTKALDQRAENLDGEEVQLRHLQFELLQLQNELIESQLATREAINDLRISGLEVDAMTKLQFELNQRFDFVMKIWSQFTNEMQQMADMVANEPRRMAI